MTARSRFVSPESERLEISNGDWVLIRKRLNAGEYREHMRRSFAAHGDRIDTFDYNLSLVVSYLLNWSLPVPITDELGVPMGIDDLKSVIDNLDPDTFSEINKVIVAHVDQQEQARAEAKKNSTGIWTSATTSPSPSDAGGPSTTSAT